MTLLENSGVSDPNRDQEGTTEYLFVGRTATGRYLQVFLILKPEGAFLKTAFDASNSQRTWYNRN